jgi:hypothetical protein
MAADEARFPLAGAVSAFSWEFSKRADAAEWYNVRTSLTGALTGHALEGASSHWSEDGIKGTDQLHETATPAQKVTCDAVLTRQASTCRGKHDVAFHCLP